MELQSSEANKLPPDRQSNALTHSATAPPSRTFSRWTFLIFPDCCWCNHKGVSRSRVITHRGSNREVEVSISGASNNTWSPTWISPALARRFKVGLYFWRSQAPHTPPRSALVCVISWRVPIGVSMRKRRSKKYKPTRVHKPWQKLNDFQDTG